MAKRYINVAYKDRDMAKRLGARWDPSVRRWYCPPGSALAKVYSWRKASGTVSASAPASAPAAGSEFGSAPSAMPPAARSRRSPPSGQLSFLA